MRVQNYLKRFLNPEGFGPYISPKGTPIRLRVPGFATRNPARGGLLTVGDGIRSDGKEQRNMGNQIRTTFLLGLLTALIVWAGHMAGGRQGMFVAFLIAAGMNFFSYWFSDKLVLKMYSAQPVDEHSAPDLFRMVRALTQRANLPMPKIYVIPQEAPNAFATGRNPENAAVAVTEGLLKLMNRDEIMGVLAHELAHVRNRDILIGSIAATLAGAIMVLSNMARFSAFFGGGRSDEEGGGGGNALGLLVMAIFAPLAAMLIQMAISRSREYMADASGAAFAGSPEGLAKALEKLGAYSKRLPMEANPSTAHMFIVNPLSGRSLMNLFSTHPPLEERIARLRGRPYDGGGMEEPPRPEDRERQAREMWERLSGEDRR
jgi:heat shock protein HtpX